MLIGDRNGMLAGEQLPYDAELEYLESTGTQYIDTGVAINCTTDIVDCRVTVTSVKTYGTAFGVYESIGGAGRFWGVRRNGVQDLWQSLWGTPTHALDLNSFYNIHYEYGTDKCYINETTGTSNTNIVYTRPLYVCALNSPTGVAQFNTQRLYSFSIKRNNLLVLDLVPVRFTNESSQTEGAMYDKVSGELLRNPGTGAFILGPDVSTSNGGGGV